MNYKKLLSQLKRKPRVHGYISPSTETRLSSIHGLGLFAKRDIKKGEVVAAWGGCVVTDKEIKKFPKDIGYHYALKLYQGFYLAEKKQSELDSADFINHSCSANCKNINRFVMVTKRIIKNGEELSSDFSSRTNKKNKFICNCKTSKCKGNIYFD